jgi:hypothetical protein
VLFGGSDCCYRDDVGLILEVQIMDGATGIGMGFVMGFVAVVFFVGSIAEFVLTLAQWHS